MDSCFFIEGPLAAGTEDEEADGFACKMSCAGGVACGGDEK
jgi:hypothetical protein